MSDAMRYGFLVGQRLAPSNVKTAVNLSGLVTGINKGVRGLMMGAADTASAAKPAVAAATAPTGAAGAASKMTIGPQSFAAPAINQARAAAAANPHAHQFGQPLRMAPPAGSAPAVRPASAPPALPAAPFRAPQAVGTSAQRAQMFFDNAQSGGRQQMLGYGTRGAPDVLPQKWEQLSPEQQATVIKSLGE